MRSAIRVVAILLLLAAFPGIHAQDEVAEEEVYVYTNADVEKLEPIPTGSSPFHVLDDPDAWAFVADFIKNERAKISSDRNHELERDYVEIEANRPVGYGERYPVYLRVPHYPVRLHPPVVDGGEPDAHEVPATKIPHPMFRERPPVREFVPGLGDSYRGFGSGEGREQG